VEENWTRHESWDATVGGPHLTNHNDAGSTLFGVDISVHPDARRKGIGRTFYQHRMEFVRNLHLERFGTACRLPDFAASGIGTVEDYVAEVQLGIISDRTLTPLLKYGLRIVGTSVNHMEDPESRNSAAILEWKP